MNQTFVQSAIKNGGEVAPIVVNYTPEYKSNGAFNPSIYNDVGCLYLTLRSCNYTLFHSEDATTPLANSPKQTFHILGEDKEVKVSTNFFCYLETSNLKPYFIHKINTDKLDKPPMWVFSGLEDPRLVKWNDSFFLCGSRRDTENTGIGRMELSEVEVKYGHPNEINRRRIPAPGKDNTYCEKNWMPILSMPFHFIKWTNPTEMVRYNPITNTTDTLFVKNNEMHLSDNLRGGSQVIDWDGGYLAVVHEVYSTYIDGKYDHEYKQQFIFWDDKWNLIKCSDQFTMMGAKIEFVSGLTTIDDDVIISFGHQDSTSFVVRVSNDFIRELLHG